MLRWFALGAWMVGCTTSPINQGDTLEDLVDAPESTWSDGLPQAVSPPPRELSLSGAAFIEVGTTQRLTVSGAEPGSTVRVIAGVFSEDYMCPEDVLSGVDVVLPDCIDIQLRGPAGTKTHILLPPALADGEGVAVFDVTIPDSERARLAMAAGVHFQALQWGDPGGISAATVIVLCDNSDGDPATDCPSTTTTGTSPATCSEVGGDTSWIGDGYCDADNNNASCGFDGGDCCPSDCDPDSDGGCDFYYTTTSPSTYTYSDFRPSCEVCLDPESVDNLPGGACYEDVTTTTPTTTGTGTTTTTTTTTPTTTEPCEDDPDWVDDIYGVYTCDEFAFSAAAYPDDIEMLCAEWDSLGLGILEGCPVLCGLCDTTGTTSPTTTTSTTTTTGTGTGTTTTEPCEDDLDFLYGGDFSCYALDTYAMGYGGWEEMCADLDLWEGCPASCGLCDTTSTTPTTTDACVDTDWSTPAGINCDVLADTVAIYGVYLGLTPAEACDSLESYGAWGGVSLTTLCPLTCDACDTTTTTGTTTSSTSTDAACNDALGTAADIGDGYCDLRNNISACLFDGGDCCPSDCDPYSKYGCDVDFYRPSCEVCLDPESVDNAPGGECYDAGTGEVCEDNPDYVFVFAGSDPATCEDLDAYASAYGGWPSMCTLFELGDPGFSTECAASCGLCDDDTSTTTTPTTTGPPPPTCSEVYGFEEYIGDGYCDPDNNNAACGFDGGDCCPSDCDPDSYYGCAYYYIYYDYRPSCEVCLDPESVDNLPGGECYE